MTQTKENQNQNQQDEQLKERIERIHKLAEQPLPLSLDEVSAAYIAACRAEDWETLGETFGGRKIGAIYAHIMDVLNERIEDFNSEIINAEEPLSKQNKGVISFMTIDLSDGCCCHKK